MGRLRVAVVLVDRANYGRLRPILRLLKDDKEVELQIIVTGSMLLDRFGNTVNVVEADGFTIDERIYMELEGGVPATMVKSIGLATIELGNAFNRLKPDFTLLIGDRYEALSAAIASVYQNICLVHIQGGEVTGSIDESTRHAITKLAHYHFPATKRAAQYIIQMGEPEENVIFCGCPSADVVAEMANNELQLTNGYFDALGVGSHLDLDKRFVLVLFHPVTTEYLGGELQMMELLAALSKSGEQILLIWPNIDAGADGIAQAIRRFREKNPNAPLHAYKNFELAKYIPLLKKACCLVGNSSSFIRDASFLGTPVVLVGSRQDGRECSEAVTRVDPERVQILEAVRAQISHGAYGISTIYGEAGASAQIVEKIKTLKPFAQKKLAY